MSEITSSENRDDNIRNVIENIWHRARINAFAHKVAHEYEKKIAARLFGFELGLTLVSILGIIGVYLLASDGDIPWTSAQKSLWTVILTFFSISCTLISMFCGVMSNYMKFEVHGEAHAFLLGSYQYIAQRAREAKWPDMPHEEVVALLKDLERDFQLLKARGIEPSDEHFAVANALFTKLNDDPNVRRAQSYGNYEAKQRAKNNPS